MIQPNLSTYKQYWFKIGAFKKILTLDSMVLKMVTLLDHALSLKELFQKSKVKHDMSCFNLKH